MTPRRVDTKQLSKLLREQKESIAQRTIDDLLNIPSLRKKHLSSATLSHMCADLFESLIPALTASPENSHALRPRRTKQLDAFSLHEIQRALLIFSEHAQAAVRKRFSGEPRKLTQFSSLLLGNVHNLLLQASLTAEKRRRKSKARVENKYARLLEMANDAIILVDFDSGLPVEANPAASKLTGYTDSELKRTGLNSLVSVFDLNLVLEKANDAIERGAVRFDNLSIVTKRGKSVPVDISASAVMLGGKKHVLAIIRDIKERKKFEEDIKRKAQRLSLLNEVGRAISSADLEIEAVLTSILKSVARVIKVEAGSILKLEGEELLFLAALGEKADSVKPFRLKLGQGIAGWAAKNGKALIVRDAHSDPRYYPLVEQATGFVSRSILASPMKIGERTVGVIELINKIGGPFNRNDLELMQLISNFAAVAFTHASLYGECNAARMRLSHLCSPVASSKMAGAVVQEMKDPLGIIKNYIEILDTKFSAAGPGKEELSVISEEVDRIINIIDQLLRFSEAYSEEIKETPLNLLLENSMADAREKLESAGIKAELRLAENLPPISVIPNQMNMVFSNLIKLAMTEMPHGGALTVTTRKADASLRIEFCNSVACHTSAETDEIFLPSGVAKGLVPKGLGLYMVSNIVHRYGGDISVSASGGGNTFSISLPLAQPAPTLEAVP